MTKDIIVSSSESDGEISETSSSGDNVLVSGSDLNPDCSGVYIPNGSGGGKTMYQREDGKFIICWKGTFGRWELIDNETAEYWFRNNEDMFGGFEPHIKEGGVEGSPNVSMG